MFNRIHIGRSPFQWPLAPSFFALHAPCSLLYAFLLPVPGALLFVLFRFPFALCPVQKRDPLKRKDPDRQEGSGRPRLLAGDLPLRPHLLLFLPEKYNK